MEGAHALSERESRDFAAPMLSDVLFAEVPSTFASLVPLPSNVAAIDEAIRFAAEPSGCVAIVGPTGWGKSHVLRCTAERIGRLRGVCPAIYGALEWLDRSPRLDSEILILDDVQDVLNRPRKRQEMAVALERRQRANRATLLAMTLPKGSRAASTLLPQPREWALHWVQVPDGTERVLLLTQMAESMSLRLSAALVRTLAYHMQGDGRTLVGALQRLRLGGHEWQGPREHLRACATLQPFFQSNADWDLRMRIERMARRNASLFPKADHEELALYTMARVACITEDQIAFGMNLEPGQVYVRSMRFQRMIDSEPHLSHYVDTLSELVAQALSEPKRP